MPARRWSRNNLGLVLPNRLMVLSISVVALGALAFFATQGNDNTPDPTSQAAGSHSTPTPGGPISYGPGGPTPKPVPTPTATSTPTVAPKPVNKAKITVIVFNNTNVQGLAGRAATKVARAGWNVLKTDNWHGKVDASTVYFGPRLKAAALLLAQDLGITRVKPAFAPMNPKMLTVILTTDYQR